MLAYLDRVPLPLPVLHFDDLLLQEPLKGVLARLMGGDGMAGYMTGSSLMRLKHGSSQVGFECRATGPGLEASWE